MQQCSSFEVFSPGKVILTGEHAVVYQKDALSIAIDKYTRLSCRIYPSDMESTHWSVELKELGNEFIIEREQLRSICSALLFGSDIGLIQYTEGIRKIWDVLSEPKEHFVMMILVVLNYLILKVKEKDQIRIEREKLIEFIKANRVSIEMTSDIPVGFGLGSSSAYNVSIVKCFVFIFQAVLEIKEEEVTKDELIQMANFGEKYFHSTPSGIDATTCVNGGLIHFIKLNEYISLSNYHPLFDQVNVMLINTGSQRIAKKFIMKVSQYKANHNEEFLQAMASIQKIALDVKAIITSLNFNDDFFSSLSGLIKDNQRLLRQIQVSTEEIDFICSLLEKEGIAAKITGAGGGGFILALVSFDKLALFKSLMEDNKYAYFKLTPSIKGSYITSIDMPIIHQCRKASVDEIK